MYKTHNNNSNNPKIAEYQDSIDIQYVNVCMEFTFNCTFNARYLKNNISIFVLVNTFITYYYL